MATSADLSVTNAVSAGTLHVGVNVTYTIVATNVGGWSQPSAILT